MKATFKTKTLDFTRVTRINWLAKNELKGPRGSPSCQYHFELLLHAKNAKRN